MNEKKLYETPVVEIERYDEDVYMDVTQGSDFIKDDIWGNDDDDFIP